MRWLVLVLAALLVGAATWLLTDSDPLPPVAVLHANAPSPADAELVVPPPVDAKPDVPSAADPAAIESRESAPPPATSARAESSGPGAVFVVVDEAVEPIAGAKVQAIAGEHDLATAWTDERGIATLPQRVPSDAGYRVRAAGFWPATGVGCDPSATTRIVLRRASLLNGVVFDPAGAPVAGANVRLLPVLEGRLVAHAGFAIIEEPFEAGWSALTDDAGRFQGAWPDEDPHDLVVVAKGHAQAVVAALRFGSQGEAPVIVRLQAGATLTGVVLRADGVPLVGVNVQVATVRDEMPRGVAILGSRSHHRVGQPLSGAQTRARGEFVVNDLPGVPVAVTLVGERAAASVFTTLIAGATIHVKLLADENAALSGEVRDASGEPVRVFLYGGGLRETSTLGGEFAITDVPPGRYLAGAVRGNFGEHVAAVVQDFLVNGSTTLATTIDLAPGEQRRIVLPPPVVVTGTVTGSASVAGAPADRHIVTLEPLGGSRAHRREASVDAAGAFRIEGVPPGDYDARLHTRWVPKMLAEVRCRVRAGETTPITLAAP